MEGIKGKVSWLNPGVLEGAARTLIKCLASAGVAGGSPSSRRAQLAADLGGSPRERGWTGVGPWCVLVLCAPVCLA